MIQNLLNANKNIYSENASSIVFNSNISTSSGKKLDIVKQLNESLISELLENANDIVKLVNLNDYIDEIKVKL